VERDLIIMHALCSAAAEKRSGIEAGAWPWPTADIRPGAERETIPLAAFIRPKQTPAMYQKTR
jgi:hypothetical protein